jgi:hypothetical protein
LDESLTYEDLVITLLYMRNWHFCRKNWANWVSKLRTQKYLNSSLTMDRRRLCRIRWDLKNLNRKYPF